MKTTRSLLLLTLAALLLSSTGCATKRTITGEKRVSGYTSTAKGSLAKKEIDKKKTKKKKKSFKLPFADKK